MDRILIDRFAVKNFRSIRECDVELAPLTFFIGANASGKTSFMDAILFVSSALRDSLEKAVASRGGMSHILHQPIAPPASCSFNFYLSSARGFAGEFHLDLRVTDGWTLSVAREQCLIQNPSGDRHYYAVENGVVKGSAAVFPAVSEGRIFLSNASGLPEFRSIFDFLSGITSTEPALPGIHDLVRQLNAITRRRQAGGEEVGLGQRFRDFAKRQPDRLEIVQQYLRVIAPPFDHIDVVETNGSLMLQFVEIDKAGVCAPFQVGQASAGLVNAAEVMLELFDLPNHGKPTSAVIVEEPEAFLHPGAIQVMRDGFVEASRTRQVLVTTHSPDLLDDSSISPEWIRIVQRDEDGTHVDMPDAGTQSVIRDQLYTPGQMLRQGGLVLRSQ